MHLKIGSLHPVFMFLSLPPNKIQLQWMEPTYTELFLASTNCTNQPVPCNTTDEHGVLILSMQNANKIELKMVKIAFGKMTKNLFYFN